MILIWVSRVSWWLRNIDVQQLNFQKLTLWRLCLDLSWTIWIPLPTTNSHHLFSAGLKIKTTTQRTNNQINLGWETIAKEECKKGCEQNRLIRLFFNPVINPRSSPNLPQPFPATLAIKSSKPSTTSSGITLPTLDSNLISAKSAITQPIKIPTWPVTTETNIATFPPTKKNVLFTKIERFSLKTAFNLTLIHAESAKTSWHLINQS